MIDKTARKNLLAIASAYAKAEDLALSTVSKRFHGKQRFLDELRARKCTVSLKKLDSMVVMFGERWPVGALWPDTMPITMGRPPGRKSRPSSRPQVSAD